MRTRKKLGVAVSLCAATLLTLGLVAGSASALTIQVRPYFAGILGVGSTAPGDPDSQLCLVTADDPPAYQGKINGTVVSGHANELNVSIIGQDLTTQLPTCVPTNINLTRDDATTVAVQGTKPGGSLSIGTIAATPPGIEATATTRIRVHLSTGQVAKLPSGAVLLSGSLTGPGTADLALKPAAATTKSQLNLSACSDESYVINTANNDDSKSGGPTASAWDSTDHTTSDGDPADPSPGDPGTYLATIRGCAQVDTTVAGKVSVTKVSIAGAGASSIDFLQSSTDNPRTWDTSRGKSCSAAKVAVNTLTPDIDVSRVLICKGDYGPEIPFSIDVRGWTEGTPTQKDPYGLLNPGPPVELIAHTFS